MSYRYFSLKGKDRFNLSSHVAKAVALAQYKYNMQPLVDKFVFLAAFIIKKVNFDSLISVAILPIFL